jgi:cofilin
LGFAIVRFELTDKAKITYEEIYKGKQHRYFVLSIVDGKIDVEKIGELDATYEDFLTDIKQMDGDKKDCRFAVYDYEYTFLPEGTHEPQVKSKIFIMCWCPDDGPIRKKMLYSSSFDTLKKAYVGHKKAIQVNDEAELDSAYVEEQLRAVDRN